MLEVPVDRVREAAQLVDVVAALCLEEGPPPPTHPWSLAPGLEVALIPWREVVDTLDPESLGNVVDREQLSSETPNPLLSNRAVICGASQRGSYRSIWTWPHREVEALAESDAMVPRSRRSMARGAMLARRSWPLVAEVQAGGGGSSEPLVVLAGIPVSKEGSEPVEHGWVQVHTSTEDGGEGRLLRTTADGTPEGTSVRFTRKQLDGWKLVIGTRMCGESDGIDPRKFIEDAV